jgi:hypothetical protein
MAWWCGTWNFPPSFEVKLDQISSLPSPQTWHARKSLNLGKIIINHPVGNGLYQLFLMILGMVYYRFTHIIYRCLCLKKTVIHSENSSSHAWGNRRAITTNHPILVSWDTDHAPRIKPGSIKFHRIPIHCWMAMSQNPGTRMVP